MNNFDRQTAESIEEAERTGRAIQQITPGANVNVETVNCTSPGGPLEVINFRAEFPDGMTVDIPHMVIRNAR